MPEVATVNPTVYVDAITAINKRYWAGEITRSEWLAEIDSLEADYRAEKRAEERDHADC